MGDKSMFSIQSLDPSLAGRYERYAFPGQRDSLHIPAHPDGESGGIRTGVPELSGQHFR